MMQNIKAVAFDIDGTLYPSSSLNTLAIPYFFKHFSFFLKFNKVRKQLHKTAPLGDFYEYQSRLLSDLNGIPHEECKVLIQEIIYDGLKPFFRKIKPFKNTYECLYELKQAGYKIGILSDFPPEQKESIWGMRDLCDVCIGSEESGALKPSIYPFGILANKLECKPEEILYVGNSKKCDVAGAKNAGMKSAYILTGFRKIFNIKYSKADISFRNYRQLLKIMLK